MGTRQGLFHVLRGNTILPQDDPMARAELPRAAPVGTDAEPSQAILNSPVFLKSERDRMNAFLNKDEFRFNF